MVGGEEDQEILLMLDSGMSVEEIAKTLNKSTTGINLRMNMMKKAGINVPTPNNPKKNSLDEARSLRRELRLNKFLEFRDEAVVSPGQVSRLLADLRRIDNNKKIKKHMKRLEKENSGTFSDYVKDFFKLNLDYTADFIKLAQLLRLTPPSDRNPNRRGPEIDKPLYVTVNLMLLAGFSTREIASGLDISTGTVSKYRKEFTDVIKTNLPRDVKSLNSSTPLWVDLAVDSFEHEILGESYAIKGVYTKPTLRNRLKSEILRSSRGGAPGQWSARKAQLLANDYRKAGGGYRTNRPSRKQMALKKWNKKSYKKKLGEEIGRKYVRVSKTIKERQKEKTKR